MFDAINRNILISCLKLKIKDQSLFEIILKMFKTNIIFLFEILKVKLGVPKDNILFPIIDNIYFYDLFIYLKKNNRTL